MKASVDDVTTLFASMDFRSVRFPLPKTSEHIFDVKPVRIHLIESMLSERNVRSWSTSYPLNRLCE
jgi:hypothetical protein